MTIWEKVVVRFIALKIFVEDVFRRGRNSLKPIFQKRVLSFSHQIIC